MAIFFILSVFSYLKTPKAEGKYSKIAVEKGEKTLIFEVNRNMLIKDNFNIQYKKEESENIYITVYKPDRVESYLNEMLSKLRQLPGLSDMNGKEVNELVKKSERRISLTIERKDLNSIPFQIKKISEEEFIIYIDNKSNINEIKGMLIHAMHSFSVLKGIGEEEVDELLKSMKIRSFFPLFLVSIIIISLVIIPVSSKNSMLLPAFAVVLIWFIPGLSLLGKIIASIIYISTMSLNMIDKSDIEKFKDHSRFLLMIILYSGFWVLYFQMFDSVLWYVQAYVDAASLNNVVNKFLAIFGINIHWFFDVEHVTVINAGVIILLQLIVSNIVKKKKALPTMITGITIATVGMGILAISSNIWIFMAGIILFSIGEMTAHPKFISYIGITAPSDKKAMYMGYLFLYGVFGSSVGGIVGAKLYVHFVDNLNQPKILWLVFSAIGILTIVSLLLYNKFIAKKN